MLLVGANAARSQSGVPVISGAAGLITTRLGDSTFVQPVIAPVVLAPIGERVLVESRFDLREFVARGASGNFEGTGFTSIQYLQADFLLAPQLTLVAGRFLTPFNIYNERFTPIWIRNLQDAPLIFPIGTRTQGSSNGAMLRGVAASGPKWQLNYATFFSASSNADKFEAGRAAGARVGVYLPTARVEVGGSYQRFLQDTHYNAFGGYLDWKPSQTSDVRAELAHSPSGTGYWIEAAHRFGQPGGTSLASGFQLVGRAQQFHRDQFLPNDFLPGVNTQEADLGVNYYLPHEVRLNASYGRRFSAPGDLNTWNVAITYRFLLPIAGGSQ
jgi:hypothetical protein